MNKNAAVMDIGSARIKMQIATFDQYNKVNYFSYKDDAFLSSYVRDNELDKDYFHNVFLPKLKELINKAKEHKCEILVPIGTHIFRTINDVNYYLEFINPILGVINIIDAQTEGLVFFNRIRTVFQNKSFVLLDIGGGSVQIINSKRENIDIISIPTGTFSLEKEFQKSKEVATEQELQNMIHHVSTILKDKCHQWQNDVLIFGSNCMEDFSNSVFEKAEITDFRKEYYDLEEYVSLFEKIKGVPYEKIHFMYPNNPYFMNGADKLLLNLITISKSLKIERIVPTNESLSSSFLHAASSNISLIDNLGIKYFKMQV